MCCLAENPKAAVRLQVFKPFLAQKRFIFDPLSAYDHASGDVVDFLIYEKSREVGATNSVLMSLYHSALFFEHSSLISSLTFAKIDGGALDVQGSMLPRIRQAIRFTPLWLLQGKKVTSKSGMITIGNATIKGESGNDILSASKFGRSGRYKYVYIDEAGFWDSASLEMALTAVSLTAPIKILTSSASDKSIHYFNDLVDSKDRQPIDWEIDGMADIAKQCKVEPRAGGVFFRFETSKYNTPKKYRQLQREMSPRAFDQEVLGKRGGHTPAIINVFDERSHKNVITGKGYKLSDEFISLNLKSITYPFICWDGGAGSNTIACVVGVHIAKYNRDILIKEYINTTHDNGISESVEAFARSVLSAIRRHPYLSQYSLDDYKHYGDPALHNRGSDSTDSVGADGKTIEAVFDCRINTLDSLRDRGEYKVPKHLKGLYRDRKVSRISVLERKVRAISTRDNMPEIIILSDETGDMSGDTGCTMLLYGLYKQGYQYVKDRHTGIIKSSKSGGMEIEQNHPIVDVCDAYTYRLLEIEPTPTSVSELSYSKYNDFEIR